MIVTAIQPTDMAGVLTAAKWILSDHVIYMDDLNDLIAKLEVETATTKAGVLNIWDHGLPGKFEIGDDTFNNFDMTTPRFNRNGERFAALGACIAPGGHIVLHNCLVAQYPNVVGGLAKLTQREAYASELLGTLIPFGGRAKAYTFNRLWDGHEKSLLDPRTVTWSSKWVRGNIDGSVTKGVPLPRPPVKASKASVADPVIKRPAGAGNQFNF